MFSETHFIKSFPLFNLPCPLWEGACISPFLTLLQLQWPNVNECVYGCGQVSRLNPAMMILTYMKCLTMICRLDKEMEMKQNEAYGPVSSSQPRAPPNSTEETYELL